MNECKPYLLLEMPWLEEIDDSNVDSTNWIEWLGQQVAKYGEFHEVFPILAEDHKIIDPVEEMKQMSFKRIIIIDDENEAS